MSSSPERNCEDERRFANVRLYHLQKAGPGSPAKLPKALHSGCSQKEALPLVKAEFPQNLYTFQLLNKVVWKI